MNQNSYFFLTIIFLVMLSLFQQFFMFVLPSYSIGLFETQVQMADATDLNFFLYFSNYNCLLSFENWKLDVTWGSISSVFLNSVLCKISSVNFLGFLFGPLIFLIFYTYSLHQKNNVVYIILLPYSMYLNGMPSKELISICFVLSAYILYKENKIKLLPILMLSLFITAEMFSRPWNILIILVAYILSLRKFSFKYLFLLFSVFSISILIVNGLATNVEFNPLINKFLYNQNFYIDARMEFLRPFVSSDNIILHSILYPVRLLIVVFGIILSFFNIVNSFLTDSRDELFLVFRVFPFFLRVIDAIVLLFLLGRIFKYLSYFRCSELFIIWFFVINTFLILFMGISEKSRYIFSLTPLLLIAFNNLRKYDKK
ncbi:hypothetical protein [Paraglaciecola sp.]|uniref:hypothetical protein n=1 Tax=Paraglaciecola sp. TaxID=1920173 RepID=UPI003EF62401